MRILAVGGGAVRIDRLKPFIGKKIQNAPSGNPTAGARAETRKTSQLDDSTFSHKSCYDILPLIFRTAFSGTAPSPRGTSQRAEETKAQAWWWHPGFGS